MLIYTYIYSYVHIRWHKILNIYHKHINYEPIDTHTNTHPPTHGHTKSANCIPQYMKRALHNNVIKWKHFTRYWPFVRGIHKGQWRGALMFSSISAWTNGSVNNRNTGDLRRHRAFYDVTLTETVRRWASVISRRCQPEHKACNAWWRHQMETFYPLLALCAKTSNTEFWCFLWSAPE